LPEIRGLKRAKQLRATETPVIVQTIVHRLDLTIFYFDTKKLLST